MGPPAERSDWQLPPGVTQGTWQYSQAGYLAQEEDAFFAEHGLMSLDATVVRRHLRRPGVVVDLGCGAGRSLLPLIDDGFTGIGIDLSQRMLETYLRKAAAAGLATGFAASLDQPSPTETPDVPRAIALRGNMVDLGFLPDACVDYVLCLFSSLGMVDGAANRAAVVRHAHRILRPGGLFLVHVHNYWHNLLHPSRRGVLLRDWLKHARRPEQRGDTRYDYRGIRNFFLHLFTRRELRRLLTEAGLSPREWTLINSTGQQPLDRPWLLPGLRAHGWIVVCEKRPS